MSFKVGEKCVFLASPDDLHKEVFNYPNNNEIVEIHSICKDFKDSYDIVGYLYSKDGFRQSIHKSNLRKLDYEWVEEVISNIKPKEIEVNQ